MKLLRTMFEVILIIGGTCSVCFGLAGYAYAFYLLSEEIGPLIPAAVTILIYVGMVAGLAWAKREVNKSDEVPNVGSDNPATTGRSGVVKLDDLTVATAIREAKQRERGRSPYGDHDIEAHP